MNKYINKTNQEHVIHEIWKNKKGNLFVIAQNPKRIDHQFEWGSYYSIECGYWGHGHYDFMSIQDARKSMIENYEDLELVYKAYTDTCDGLKIQITQPAQKIDSYYSIIVRPNETEQELIKQALETDKYDIVDEKIYIELDIKNGIITGDFTLIDNRGWHMYCDDYSKKDIIYKTKNETSIYHYEGVFGYIVIDALYQRFYLVDDLEELTRLLLEDFNEEIRICSDCGAIMQDGYCIYDGEEDYCSEDCLYSKYTEEEYDLMVENDDAYYTEWE